MIEDIPPRQAPSGKAVLTTLIVANGAVGAISLLIPILDVFGLSQRQAVFLAIGIVVVGTTVLVLGALLWRRLARLQGPTLATLVIVAIVSVLGGGAGAFFVGWTIGAPTGNKDPTALSSSSQTPTTLPSPSVGPVTTSPSRPNANPDGPPPKTTQTTPAQRQTPPYTMQFNQDMACSSGCWATDRMTTRLKYVTVTSVGYVDIYVQYINHTSEDIDIVFDPPDLLSDASGHDDQAFSSQGGSGHISVPANGSTNYVISFGGLSPAPGESCKFTSDIEQGNVFTIYYADVSVPCG